MKFLGERIGARLFKSVKLREIESVFSEIDIDSKCAAVNSLISLINGSTNRADLSMVGGSKFSGGLVPNFSKLISDPKTDFVIIDQSVTGMFERRTRIGL